MLAVTSGETVNTGGCATIHFAFLEAHKDHAEMGPLEPLSQTEISKNLANFHLKQDKIQHSHIHQDNLGHFCGVSTLEPLQLSSDTFSVELKQRLGILGLQWLPRDSPPALVEKIESSNLEVFKKCKRLNQTNLENRTPNFDFTVSPEKKLACAKALANHSSAQVH